MNHPRNSPTNHQYGPRLFGNVWTRDHPIRMIAGLIRMRCRVAAAVRAPARSPVTVSFNVQSMGRLTPRRFVGLSCETAGSRLGCIRIYGRFFDATSTHRLWANVHYRWRQQPNLNFGLKEHKLICPCSQVKQLLYQRNEHYNLNARMEDRKGAQHRQRGWNARL